jgi:hypothetical protein
MVFQFVNFPNSFMFILLGNWCVISEVVEEVESPNLLSLGARNFMKCH